MTNALSWDQSTRSFQGRTYSENDNGTWPGSMPQYLVGVDGANIESLSVRKRNPEGNVRCVSAIYSNEFQNKPSIHGRISIDGSNLEALSDTKSRRSDRRSFTPQLQSTGLDGSSSNSQRNIPDRSVQRSRFANLARKPPQTITNMKRRSRIPEALKQPNAETQTPFHAPMLTPPLTPPISKRRFSPNQLPRLTIPENQRPAVKKWVGPTLGSISTTQMTSSVPENLSKNQNQHRPSSPTGSCQLDQSIISSIDSLPVITRDISHRPADQSQDISPLEPPELSHRIDLPSALDFPDYSFTPQSDSSPTIESYARMSSTKSRRRPKTLLDTPVDGNQSLFSAIYSILRSPSTASTPKSRGSALSSRKPSPTEPVAPLFSTSSRKGRFSLNRLTTRARICGCCGEKRSIAQYPIRPTARCSHESNTCQECIIQWIKSSMSNGEVRKIRCPGADCRQVISYDDVKNLVPTSLFIKYDNLLTRTRICANQDFHWCINPKCDSGQIQPPNTPRMRCNSCRHEQCVVHRCNWHFYETCAAYEIRTNPVARRKHEDKLSDKTIETITKACPHCGVRIEKQEGCDHMKCMRCYYEFCWRCSAPYVNIRKYGNDHHHLTCMYHTKNLAGGVHIAVDVLNDNPWTAN